MVVQTILADVRRTYIELRWRPPPLHLDGIVERAELTDPLGRPLPRLERYDAGTNRREYFLAFGPIPTAAPQAVLTLHPRLGGDPVMVPLRIDPGRRTRGNFVVAVGGRVVILGRTFEVVSYAGGVTEGAVIVRLQCGAASWPIEIQGSLGRHMGTRRVSIGGGFVPDPAGRIVGEMIVDGPQDPLQQTFSLEAVRGMPLPQPLAIPLQEGEQTAAVRIEPVTITVDVRATRLPDGWDLRVRTPHVQASSSVEVTGLHRAVLADGSEVSLQDEKQWPAGSERTYRIPAVDPGAQVLLDGICLRLDPSPTLRLARS